MNMKPIFTIAALLVSAGVGLAATNDVATLVQRGLFEEEANHQLEAAIRDYQGAIDGFDHDRQLAATAIFRLGECYRKLGRTNEANIQYERIVREFAEQTQLVELSRDYVPVATGGTATNETGFHRIMDAEALEKAKALVQNSPDLINDMSSGATPLGSAVQSDYKATAEFLLSHGAEINAPDDSLLETPLETAVNDGEEGMADLLLKNGADPNSRDQRGQTALNDAVKKAAKHLAEMLLAHGADVDAKDNNGQTPLFEAANLGFITMAELLISNKANVNTKGANNYTPIISAVARGRVEMVQLLLDNHADANAQGLSGMTPLLEAFHPAQGGLNQFPPAANPAMVKTLLAAGASPDPELADDWTYEEFRGYRPLIFAIASDRPDLVRLLLDYHADPNSRFPFRRRDFYNLMTGANRTPPLDMAAYKNHDHAVEIADLLLKAGAKANLVDDAGKTSLFYAVVNQETNFVRLLIDHQADVNVADEDAHPPLFYAKDPEIKRLLLAAGADPFFERRQGISIAAGPDLTPKEVFHRETNFANRYTSLELVANGSGAIAFPDFAHAVIDRLKGGATEEVAVNLDEILKARDSSKDIWLQWGDILRIPQIEHHVNESWLGLSAETVTNLDACLARTVKIVVQGNTNDVNLNLYRPPPASFANIWRAGSIPNRMIWSFLLDQVVRDANVLLNTSDLSRVRLRRKDAETSGQPLAREFDLSKEPAPQVWLRDGDEIEIPDRADTQRADGP
jgi:ankyrin repeat protein